MYGSLKNGTGKKRNHRIKDVSFSRTSLLPNNAKLLRERAVSVYIYVCIKPKVPFFNPFWKKKINAT